jgi:hypothetical protein
MKITRAFKYHTPAGTIEFIRPSQEHTFYRLVYNGLGQQSLWRTASRETVRVAILRAAARAGGLPEYHYRDTNTEPNPWPANLDFTGIHSAV